MTIFIAIAAAMIVAACAFVLVPLLRRQSAGDIEREATNLAVLRDQRAELEADLANGVLSPDQYDAARVELDRRVLEDTTCEEADVADAHRSGAWVAAIVAAALPIGAVVLYVALGNPAALSPAFVATKGGSESGHEVNAAEIESMIQRVKERLAREPDNVEGWVVLARTYYVLGRAGEATAAFERATTLAPDDANLLADYADALGTMQNRSLEGKPAGLIARALAIDPDQWKANALAGTLAFSRKDYAKAIEHWQRVKRTVPPESPVAQSIDASLDEARKLAAGAPAPAERVASAPSVGPRASIAGTVSLAPALAGSVSPDDTVFVFARPVDGTRMPLAVVRGKVRDLPLAFTLDDSGSMTPTHRISDHGEVIVGARISRSGSVAPQAGDVEMVMPPVKVGMTGVALVIDRKP